jgi:hypothetical protein
MAANGQSNSTFIADITRVIWSMICIVGQV